MIADTAGRARFTRSHRGRRAVVAAAAVLVGALAVAVGPRTTTADLARLVPDPASAQRAGMDPIERLGGFVPNAAPAGSDVSARVGGIVPERVTDTGPRVTVPILMYHYVRAPAAHESPLGVGLSVTPELFAQQMALLKAEGGHAITFGQLMDALNGKQRLPSHPVILTFDDGYADFATAAQPVLVTNGFTAVDYVVSGFINHPGYMSATQVRAMEAAGFVVGSHTVHHLNLAQVLPEMARIEIEAGKAALERLLGHPVVDFAYPYGGLSAEVAAMVQHAGFREAVTTMGGTTQALNSRYLLRRTRIGGTSQSLAAFATAAGIPQSAGGPGAPHVVSGGAAPPSATAHPSAPARPSAAAHFGAAAGSNPAGPASAAGWLSASRSAGPSAGACGHSPAPLGAAPRQHRTRCRPPVAPSSRS